MVNTPRRLFSKTSIVSISLSSDQKDGSTMKFFFQLSIQTLLHRLLYWKMRWTYEVFQGIQRWPLIKLVTLIHSHSYLILLEIVVGCYKFLEGKKFSRNPGQFKWVTRETRYHLYIAKLLIRNLMSQLAELFQRPRTMLKIFYFSVDHQFFQKSLGIKFLYDWGRERFHLLAGEA